MVYYKFKSNQFPLNQLTNSSQIPKQQLFTFILQNKLSNPNNINNSQHNQNMNKTIAFLVIFVLALELIDSQYCLNAAGEPVSWWIVLKVPPMIGNTGYGYYDSNTKTGQFIYNQKTIDLDVSPLTQTLAMINKQKLQRVAWNDQKPNNQTSSSKAHSKGVIAYSAQSGRGFYIVHSIPKYPAFLTDHTINMTIPNSENIYGQHIACFSLSVFELNNIAQRLMLIHPFVYEQQVTSRVATQYLYDMALGKTSENKELFEFYQMRPTNFTMSAIFKNNNLNGSIFEDGLVKWLKVGNVVAETWGRPLQAPWCSQGFAVINVQEIQLTKDIVWTEAEDHSKWMLSGDRFSCFGDMNRMSSQWKRGGAFYCLEDPTLNAALRKIILLTDQCTSIQINEQSIKPQIKNLKFEFLQREE